MKSTLIGFSLGYITPEKTKGINLLSIISPKQKVYSIRVEKFWFIRKNETNIIELEKKLYFFQVWSKKRTILIVTACILK